MRKTNVLIFIFIMSIIGFKSYAQDQDHPWVFGLGFNSVDVSVKGVSDIGDNIEDYFRVGDNNILPVISRVNVARYIGKGFSGEFVAALNSIDESPVGPLNDLIYYSFDLGARYDLNNWFGDTKWFDPYVKLGVGFSSVDKDLIGTINPGLGFNTWFNDRYGLNFESKYKLADLHDAVADELGTAVGFPNGDHFQHSISLVVRFGQKDTDRDGVKDEDDLCPDVKGSKKTGGCPDSDDDGIKDEEDACPNVAGAAETKGCPDTDGDGVHDGEDKCPEVEGTANGCPDKDNDGVADADDKCPDVAGVKKGDGCPKEKKKGKKKKGKKGKKKKNKKKIEPKPEPIVSEEVTKTLGSYAKTIQFNSGKATFKSGVSKTLDDIASVMKEYPDAHFEIQGHSDSAGNDNLNLKLSQKRAQAVVNYLGSHGIDATRLKAKGYGEAKPIASNNTAAGRAINRRVEIKAIP